MFHNIRILDAYSKQLCNFRLVCIFLYKSIEEKFLSSIAESKIIVIDWHQNFLLNLTVIGHPEFVNI